MLEKEAENEFDRTPYQLSEIEEHREILKTIRARQWNMMGYIFRHENQFIYEIIKEKFEDKRGAQEHHLSNKLFPMLDFQVTQN